jgi:hypothetical protein
VNLELHDWNSLSSSTGNDKGIDDNSWLGTSAHRSSGKFDLESLRKAKMKNQKDSVKSKAMTAAIGIERN